MVAELFYTKLINMSNLPNLEMDYDEKEKRKIPRNIKNRK